MIIIVQQFNFLVNAFINEFCMSQQFQKSYKEDTLKTKMSSFYEQYQHGFSFMKDTLQSSQKQKSYQQIQDEYDEQVYKALSSGVYQVRCEDNQGNLQPQQNNNQSFKYHSVEININKYINQSVQETLYESCRQKEQSEIGVQQQNIIKSQLNHIQKEQFSAKNQVQQSSKLQLQQEDQSYKQNKKQSLIYKVPQQQIKHQIQNKETDYNTLKEELLYPPIISQEYKITNKQKIKQQVEQIQNNDQQKKYEYEQIYMQNDEVLNQKSKQIILKDKLPLDNKQKVQLKKLQQFNMNNRDQLYQSQEQQQHINTTEQFQQTLKNDNSSSVIQQYPIIQQNIQMQPNNQQIQYKQHLQYKQPSLIKQTKINHQNPINLHSKEELSQININLLLSKEIKVPLSQLNKNIDQKDRKIQIVKYENDWKGLKWKGKRRIKRQSDLNPSNKRAGITGYNKQYFLLLETQVYDIEIKGKDSSYSIKRTFYDFSRLQELIKVYFRGHILHPFPQVNFQMFKKLKLSMGNQQDKIILNEKRLLHLQRYLNYLLNHQIIKSSILLQIFLNSNEQFFKKQFQNLQKVTNQRQKQTEISTIGQRFNDIKRVIKFGWNILNQYMPNSINNSQNIEIFHKIKLQASKNQEIYMGIKLKLQEYIRQTTIFWERVSRLKQIYRKNAGIPNMQSNIDSVLILSSKLSSSRSYYQWFCEWLEDNILPEIKLKMQILNQISQMINYRQSLSIKLNNLTIQNIEFGNRIVEKQENFDERFLTDWHKKRQQFQDDIKQLQSQILCVWKYFSKLMLKIWKGIA